MDEIRRRKIAKLRDCGEWTPEECLEYALDDLKTGTEKATKVFVFLVHTDGESDTITPYRCNVTHVESVGYLEMFKDKAIKKWQGE